MSPSLFQFELRPLDLIQPWGAPDAPSLSWFGLTDGHFGIQVGEDKLFEYANEVGAGDSRFCGYQIVRLYEDVLELAPYALEPVPRALQRFISLDDSKSWDFYASKWGHALEHAGASDDFSDALYDAVLWSGRRKLDSGYLSPSARILCWSDEDAVHIEWDNRGALLHGRPVWAAQFGSWRLSREDFMNEVRSFHSRLMEQMAQRVAQVLGGGVDRRVHVDLDALQREQRVRSRSIEGSLCLPAPPTDWLSVHTSVALLEARTA